MEPVETAVERLQKELDRLLPRTENTAKITVNAGGIGVWIAVTACVTMLAVVVVGSVFVTREFIRQDQQLKELRDNDGVHDAWIQTLNNNKQDKQR